MDLDGLLTALELKEERRTGWQLRGVADPESVAAHSWGVALLVLAYAEEAGVDPDRALRMAVVHDLPEAETGDVAVRAEAGKQRVDPDEKERRERAAIERVAGGEVRELWTAYEDRDSPEARFVKDMDLIDMCLQALFYEREDRYEEGGDEFEEYEALDEFFATAEPRLTTDVGRRLFEEVRERYRAARD